MENHYNEPNKVIKILSVDDEPDMEDLLRQKFRKQMKMKVFEFYFAHDGYEALEILQKEKGIDFLLCDINMPGMDGLTLLTELTKLERPALQTIMVTAFGDMENLRTAMNNGAFDFVNKPINFDDLEKTMDKTVSQVIQIRKSLEERDQLIAIQKDLEVAKLIQLSLVPSIFPPFPNNKEIDIFASMHAAKTVGGDLYDFFFIDKNRIGFVIGDVSGKGIPAAIFMALSRTIIRTIAHKGDSTEKCIEESNNSLCKESIDQMFVTAFYGILNVETGDFLYTNAGHTLPYVIRTNGDTEQLPKTGNMVMGIMDEIKYNSKTTKLFAGDTVYLYTDGVTEAMNAQSEIYTEIRLESILKLVAKKSVEEICRNVEDDIYKFSGGVEQSDDITSLVFRFNGLN